MDETKQVIEEQQMSEPYEKPSVLARARKGVKTITCKAKRHGKAFLVGVFSAAALAGGGYTAYKKLKGDKTALDAVSDAVSEALPFDGESES